MSFARRAVEKAIISISGPRTQRNKNRSEHARRDWLKKVSETSRRTHWTVIERGVCILKTKHLIGLCLYRILFIS